MSVFAWLAYSEAERRSALDVIALFQERDTRDELGLGVIRDAFADVFFPGTSTIQRRARYFLFVPWAYLKLEEKRIPSAQVAQRARREEVDLIEQLVKADDHEGTIGIDARQTLKRLPSNVYWQGLGRLGIRLFPGSQDQYHRSLDRYYARLKQAAETQTDDREPIGGRLVPNWHASLPPRPPTFPKGASFKLTHAEADYLRERILTAAPTSLFAFLVDEGKRTTTTGFPWEHSQYGEFPLAVRTALGEARNFSEVMHGAALLYNLMLAQEAHLKDRTEEYTAALGLWRRKLEARWTTLTSWDRRAFWALVADTGARLRPQTRRFVDTWLDITLVKKGARVATDSAARDLVHQRERALKGPQARLDNPRALELWRGAAGAHQINYRWDVVQVIVDDIRRGYGS